MDSHDSRDAHSHEAAADGHASSYHTPAPAGPVVYAASGHDELGHPFFDSPEAETLYWRAYMDGSRVAGREPGHPHMPADFDLDLSRDPASPSLVSAKLIETWPEAVPVPTLAHGSVPTPFGEPQPEPAAPPTRAIRHDGWTGERQRLFLDALARTGVVADACRIAGIGRDSAYGFRRRAAGAAFAVAWDAALLIARNAIADDVMSRARHGVVDRVYRNGELVAERHRYDNRLTMAVLTRLDRTAEGLGENAPVARAVAAEWDQFLDTVEEGPKGAARFLQARAEPAAPLPPANGRLPEPVAALETDPLRAAASRLARLSNYREHGAGLPSELSTADLDPAAMESWSEEQLRRAEASGFLDRLAPEDWPLAVREAREADTDGSCRLRRLYLDRHPPAPAQSEAEEDDFGGCYVWEEGEGEWYTDFPPPPDFDGYQVGEPGRSGYRRELTEDEMAVIEVDLAHEDEGEENDLTGLHAARDRFFGFAAAPPPLDPRWAPDQS
jgi:hypothetical protein